MEHYLAQGGFNLGRQFAHGGARWGAVRLKRNVTDDDRFREVQQGGTAKGRLLSVVKSRRHNVHVETVRRRCRGDGDARYAGLQRLEPWLIMRDAFRKTSNRYAARQKLARGRKCFQVARNIFAGVLPAVCRQAVE